MHIIRIRNSYLRTAFAEFLGTFILVLIGNCSVAQALGNVHVKNSGGSDVAIPFGYAVGVFVGGTVSIGISDAHLNPAITLALALCGKFPLRKVIPYLIAQYLGGFLSAVVTWGVYSDLLVPLKIDPLDPEAPDQTASIFATYPMFYLTTGGAVLDQVIGTAVLAIGAAAVGDPNNASIPRHLKPLYMGTVVLGIGLALGINCGYAINPARDFGPRLFTLIAGWTPKTFTFHNYAWIPIVGPHLGALIGLILYIFFIELHEENEEEETRTQSTIEIQRF